jgi:4-diphosphocytidyl-2-C-methyl-D-erythritol kinase
MSGVATRAAGEPLGWPEPWPAPGKLNLFLHVVGRREDGYHRLQTAFQFIDLCDDIRFYRRAPGVIERIGDVPGVPADADLALKAARRLQAQARPGCPGVAIEITKRLPIQAGVGGGSSDAATVLTGLRKLWGLAIDTADLARLGLELGADVPVFLGGRAAWAEGVGELLTPVDFPETVFVLVCPDARVSTAEVFKAPELTRDSQVIKIRDFLETGGRNDCEPVVRRRFAAVAEALDWLGQFAPARLTGTGSCVFAAMPGEAEAREVVARVPSSWRAYTVRGLNRSPLAARLAIEKQELGSGR